MNTLHDFLNFFHYSDSSGHQLNSQTHVTRATDTILKDNQISSAKMFTVSDTYKSKSACPCPKKFYLTLYCKHNKFSHCEEGTSVAVLFFPAHLFWLVSEQAIPYSCSCLCTVDACVFRHLS